MNFLNKKRTREAFENPLQDSESVGAKPLQVSSVLNTHKKSKLNDQNCQEKNKEKSVTIKLKDLVQAEKGFFNLPKEIIEEAMALKFNVLFKPKRDNGDHSYYYSCNHIGCPYSLKIKEYPNLIKNITLSTLISNYKDFDLSNFSDLEEGICHITEYGDHKDDHHKGQTRASEFSKAGLV